MKRAIVPGLAAGLLLLSAASAAAQSGGLSNSLRPNLAAPQQAPRQAPPPALPGSRTEPTAVAPATRVPTDMPPTEALFDAINRGDVGAARDAINRGADLNGQNVLGLTPLELSVDLGRNDISFMLLSMRPSTPAARPEPAATAAPRPPTRAERLAAERAERAERAKQARQARLEAEAARAKPAGQAPRLFAGDGGSAIPQAGFLGFDPAR